jgi:uncharacterized membrane protein YphA (DoxX/SURF4 family)
MKERTSKKSITKKKVFIEICCFLLVLLFLYASVSKLVDLPTFTEQMHYQPFPVGLSDVFIWLVPRLQIAIALFVVSPFIPDGIIRTIGLWGSLVLMSLFTLYNAAVLLHFFNEMPCSCIGVIDGLSWLEQLVFNVFFVAVAGAALWLRRKPKRKESVMNMSKNISVNAVS